MTATKDIQLDLGVARSLASALIRAEVRAGEQRTQLERAVRDLIVKCGRSIDAVSEATGLSPDEIRRIAAEPAPLEDLDALCGIS